ncbi:MAG: imidazolonepropionase [Pseudoxanthomonas sp.]
MPCDTLWHNAHLVTLDTDGELGIVRDGAIAARDGRIAWLGPASQLPAGMQAANEIDCGGRWITPGLIDCHTHLVHAGNRANEFEQRLQGVSYADIARAGGGIVSTVRATRAASEDELLAQTLPRLDAMLAEGVTTVEIKSGYGLTLEDEIKQLRVARNLGELRAVSVSPTFLGAHAVPPGREAQDYINEVCNVMIPAIAAGQLAEAVDVFCENIAFSPEQARQVFEAAQRHGLKCKIHAEQLSNQHGAALAAGFGALSADHIEHLDNEGIAAMARAGTVAVLLPGAFYFTRDTLVPPVQALRDAGVPIALATDCNPGTSPLTSPLLAMNMGATLFRLTVAECITGFTRIAARALGRDARIGQLRAGFDCDLAIWNIDAPADLVYRIGFNPLHARVHRGACTNTHQKHAVIPAKAGIQ